MELFFVRHIKPNIEAGICYGHTDVPIPTGSQQAIIDSLPSDFDVVYTSPLSRCRLLAEQISTVFIEDARLMELNFGDWEGKKWDEINREELDIWGADYVTLSPPNGETLTALAERLQSFIRDLSQQKVIIVTHSGIIRCAMHLLKGIPLHQIMMEQVDFGGIYKFEL
jgi:alpha-ribazole phosphatase